MLVPHQCKKVIRASTVVDLYLDCLDCRLSEHLVQIVTGRAKAGNSLGPSVGGAPISAGSGLLPEGHGGVAGADSVPCLS